MDILLSPDHLLRVVRRRLGELQQGYKELIAEKTGKEVTCSPGCAFCCYAKVVVDAGQGVLMYLYLNENGLWNDEMVGKLIEAEIAMADSSHAEWIGKKRPCVFLKEDAFGRGACTVYDARPVGCASTFSTAGDPPGCAVPGGKHLSMAHSTGAANMFGKLYSSIAAGLREETVWLFTIPGAVLYGCALVRGLPMPPVRRIDLAQIPDDDIAGAFDRKEPSA